MTRAEWNETLKKCAKEYHSKKGTQPRKRYSKKSSKNKSMKQSPQPQVISKPIVNRPINQRGARFPFNLVI